MATRTRWFGVAAIGIAAAAVAAGVSERGIASRARAALAAFRPDLRAKAAIAFDDAERMNWHFIPRDRRGVALKEMNDDERRATHALLRTMLSTQGYLAATSILSLDEELRRLAEAQGRSAPERDALRYHLTVFGTPDDSADAAPWAVRFEGHHLSVNVTRQGGRTAVTPFFLGSNPAEVRTGPHAGLRPLAEPEDLGHELIASLTPEQRKHACLSTAPPQDILLGPGIPVALPSTEGIAAHDLDATTQLPLFRRLVHSVTGDVAAELIGRDRVLDPELRFAFAGDPAPGKECYFRVWCEQWAIELDNVQNDANHVHLVWRDANDDFGARLLTEHLKHDHR